MNRIIRPVLGKPVKRVTVDVDIQGQTQISGYSKGPLGQTVPMSMFDVCCLLSNVVASSLLAMAGRIPLKTKDIQNPQFKYPDSTGHEFLAAAESEVICQLCGGHQANHDGSSDAS